VVAPNSTTGTAAIRLASNSTLGADGADNNTIKNCIITGGRNSATSTTVSYGIVMSDASGITTGAYKSLNTIIQNNIITQAWYGIYCNGSSATYLNSGIQILNNTIGSATSAQNIGFRGIYITNSASTAGVGSAIISGNDIRVGDYGTTGYGSTIAGVEIANVNAGCVISKNNIHDINQPSTSGYGAHGIYITGATSNAGISIFNNFIRDCKMVVYQTSTTSVYIPTGVFITAAATNLKIDYNTISMGTQLGAGANYSSLCVDASVSGITIAEFLDNILVNTHSSTYAFGLYCAATTAISAGNVNYNDYYCPNGNVGYYNGANRTLLAAWQTATTKDNNSISILPGFVSATDLHIALGSTAVNNLGIPVAGILYDYDGDARNTSTPDIGADEFSPIICAGASGGTFSPTTANACVGIPYTMSPVGYEDGRGATYQWEVSAVGGGVGFANVVGGTGATSAAYTTGTLAAGTYYYRLRVDCSNGPVTDYSNELSLIVHGLPTVAVTPNTALYCSPSGTPIALTASGANTYTWSPSAGLDDTTGSVVNASPATTSTYTVSGTDAFGCYNTASAAITVGASVTATATATPSSICTGNNSQLLASGSQSFTTPTPSVYGFTGSTGTYSVITGTTLTVSSTDDNGVGNLPIGFSFNYNGTNHTIFGMRTNGLLELDQASATLSGFSSNALASNANCIAPLWDDNNVAGGTMIYSTTGVAGSRVLTAQWTGMHVGGSGSSTNPTIDVQVKLYEGSNKIEFIYGSTSAALSGTSASIGISGASGNYLSVTPLSPPNTSTTSNSTENSSISSATNFPSGTVYTFTPAGAPVFTYAWSPSTFITGQESIINPLATAITTTTTYTVTVNGNSGCFSSASASVNVSNNAVINTQPAPDTKCAGQTATFTVSATGPSLTYVWRKGGIAIDNIANPSAATATLSLANVSTADVASYDVVISASCGTPVTSTAALLTVNSLPTVAVTPTSGTYCTPGGPAINLTASGASTYSWSPAAGLDVTTGATVNASPAITTTYVVTGTDGNGCANTASAAITVGASVTATATATPSSICAGNNSQLLAVGTQFYNTQADSYIFTTASGTTLQNMTGAIQLMGSGQDVTSSSVTNIGFTFNFGGTNYTQFSASSNGALGLGSTAVTTLDGNNSTTSPTILPAWDDMHTATNGNVQYILNTTGGAGHSILIVEWNYGNYAERFGTFTKTVQVWLYESTNQIKIVYGANTGAALSSATVGIVTSGTNFNDVNTSTGINSTTTAQDANTVWPALGTTYIFTPTGAPVFTYSWSPLTFIAGEETLANPLATAVTITTGYTVTVTGNAGCFSTATATVNVTNNAVINTQPAPETKCAGQTATFTVSATGPSLTYAWRKDGVAINTILNPSAATATLSLTNVSTLDVANYDVIVSASCGSPITSDIAALTVNALPTVAVSPTTGSVCIPGGSAVALTASGASTYLWSPATGLDATSGTLVNANPASTTTYTVTGTDLNGCANTASSTITVAGTPLNPIATATPNNICRGLTSNLTSSAYFPSSTTVNNYLFSTATGATLADMTGATQVIGSGVDDTPTATPAPIGFNFNYDGTNYTQYSVSPDGWILLGGATAADEYTNAVTSTLNIPKIYPYWSDLATGTDGNVQTLVTGTAPNRIFIVQWFVTIPRITSGAANSTFQVWLYETSNKIEFKYGTMGVPTSGSISAGLTGATATNFNSVTYSTNTASNSVANDANAIAPESGRVYTFTPPSVSFIYSWTPAADVADPANQNTATNALTATTVFTVTINNSGCTSTANTTVSVTDIINITAQPVPVTTCAGQTASFTVGATGPNLIYEWRKNGVTINNVLNPSAATATLTLTNVSASDAANYDVIVSATCGSPVTSNAVALTVNPLPTVVVTPSSASYCIPGSSPVALTASGANTYTWSPATGLDATTGTIVNASPATTTTYIVSGTDGNGCINTASASINVGAAVTATATATPDIICSGSNSQLLATGTQFFNQQANGYAFSSASGTSLQNMTGATQLLGSGLDFSASALANIGFTFNFGGTNYTQFSVSSNGVMGLGSTAVSSADGNNSTTAPTIIPGWDDMHTCTNGNVQYFLNTSGGAGHNILVIEWNYGNYSERTGPFTKTVQVWLYETTNQIKIVYGANTGITLSSATVGIVTSATNFNDVNTTTGVNSATVSQDGNSVWPALGTTYIFDPATAPVFTYSWSPSTFIAGQETLANPLATAVTATTGYTVTVTGNAGCNTTATATVTVSNNAAINIQPLPVTKCAGETATFTITATGPGITYQWYKGSVAIDDILNPSAATATLTLTNVSASDAANYDCIVTATCGTPVTSDIVALIVNPLPVVAVNPTSASICNPGGSPVNITATGADTYSWSPANGLDVTTGANVIANPASTTMYTVTGTTTLTGCTNTATSTISVGLNPVGLAINPTSATICLGTIQQLTASVSSSSSATATSGALSLAIPDANATGVNNALSISGIPAGATINNVLVTFNITHPYDQDILINLEAPNGQIINLVSGINLTAGAGANFTNTSISSDDTYPVMLNSGAPFTATYRADKVMTGFELNPTPMPTTAVWNDLFTTPNGAWKLKVMDDESIGIGTFNDWNIQISYTLPTASIKWSPTTGLYTDAAATIPYAGTDAATIYAKPLTNQIYTVTATSDLGCISTANVPITVTNITPNLGHDTTLCDNGSITLNAGTGYDTYLWSTGATTQTITVDTTGIGIGTFPYSVTVTLGTCSSNGNINITFTNCVGIIENSGNISVNIFPNPTTGLTNVIVEGLNSNSTLTLLSVQGQLIYTTNIDGKSSTQLDLSNFPAGIYMIRVYNEKYSILKKLIKQ